LFDGEGVITVYTGMKKTQPSWMQIRVSVHMTDRAVLKLFAKRFGGPIYRETHKDYLQHKPIYRWCAVGRKSQEALKVFAKHCVIKSAQAKLALEAISLLVPNKYVGVPADNLERRFGIAKEVARLKRIPVDDALGV
jgi:hypothetical protein